MKVVFVLIYDANRWTGFYMIGRSIMKDLRSDSSVLITIVLFRILSRICPILSSRSFLSYRNHSINLLCKSMDYMIRAFIIKELNIFQKKVLRRYLIGF